MKVGMNGWSFYGKCRHMYTIPNGMGWDARGEFPRNRGGLVYVGIPEPRKFIVSVRIAPKKQNITDFTQTDNSDTIVLSTKKNWKFTSVQVDPFWFQGRFREFTLRRYWKATPFFRKVMIVGLLQAGVGPNIQIYHSSKDLYPLSKAHQCS